MSTNIFVVYKNKKVVAIHRSWNDISHEYVSPFMIDYYSKHILTKPFPMNFDGDIVVELHNIEEKFTNYVFFSRLTIYNTEKRFMLKYVSGCPIYNTELISNKIDNLNRTKHVLRHFPNNGEFVVQTFAYEIK